jgi:hypothetical protein
MTRRRNRCCGTSRAICTLARGPPDGSKPIRVCDRLIRRGSCLDYELQERSYERERG